jgi:hypothetical protein
LSITNLGIAKLGMLKYRGAMMIRATGATGATTSGTEANRGVTTCLVTMAVAA